MKAQLVQKEEEKKQLESKMDEIQKERESLEQILKEDREKFEDEMRRIVEVCIYKPTSCIHILVKKSKNHRNQSLKSQDQLTIDRSFTMMTSNLNKKLAVGLLEMFMKHCYRMNELSSRLVGTLKTETGFCMKQTF